MKRLRPPALVLGGLLLVTACGSTVHLTGSDAVGGGLDNGLPEPVASSAPSAAGPIGTVNGPSAPSSTTARSPLPSLGQTGPSALPVSGARSTTPIEIGVLITDTDSFQKAAGGTSYSLLTRDAIHAYIRAINAAGGIDGHQLKVVDATFNYEAASYDNEFQAACQTFTKDHHVGAVIYDGLTYNTLFNTCLTQAGVPSFLMHQVGTQLGDKTDMASYPGLFTAGSVTMDRRLESIMEQSVAHHFLGSGSKLGVIVEDCDYATRAFGRTVVPFSASHHITISRVDLNCGAGSADHATGINALGSAVLRFQTEGVDSVMFVTDYENGAIFYFAAAAEAQHYRPQYLLWANQGSQAYLDYYNGKGLGAQLQRMRGFGNNPMLEVTHAPTPPAAQIAVRQLCVDTAKRQQLAIGDDTSKDVILDACDVVNLLHKALAGSGGLGGTRAVVNAVNQFGTSFVSTMILDGATRFGPGLHDGPELGEVSAWQTTCSCMAFIAPPYTIAS